MRNKRMYNLVMLFVFLIIFFGCKKNNYFYENDNTYLSGKYTDDDKYYDSQAGEYKSYFRMSTDYYSYNSDNELYDTIAVCPIRFGNHADRYVYCKSPISAFASMLPYGEDRDALASCTDSIEIVAPYEVRIWSLSEHEDKFDYEFGYCIKSFVKTINAKRYVITLRIAPRGFKYNAKKSNLYFTDWVYIGMCFADLELRRDGRRLPFADGCDISKYDIVGSEWLKGKSPVLFDE